MRILVLSERFTPEISAASARIQAHGKVWQEQGHEVVVVTCAPNAPRGKIFEGYQNKRFQEEVVDGLPVIRLWSYMAANEGVIRRTADYASFAYSIVAQARSLPDPDVILATSPPIFVPMAGHFLAKRKRKPWVLEVRDLWPASIKGVGVAKGAILRPIEKIELGLYASAKRVIVVTEPFRDDLTTRGVPEEKIDVVTNGTDIVPIDPNSRAKVRHEFGLSDSDFVVGFAGTMGMAQGSAILVRAAARLKDRSQIRFLVVGEGAERAMVESQARAMNLPNIRFHNFIPHDRVPELLNALDLGTVLLKNDPVFETVIPSKIFELFAARRPVLAAAAGEARRVIESAAAGVCVEPENDADFADRIIALEADPGRLETMARNGLEAVRAHYSRTAMAHLALQSLLKAA